MWIVSAGRLPGLYAQVRFDWEMVILAVVAAGLIFAGVAAVVRVRNWRAESPAPPTLAEQLQTYQQMVDDGELDREEFERIKVQLERSQTPPS